MLVDRIQEAFDNEAALIINPAGFSFGCVPAPYTHSSVSKVAGTVICGEVRSATCRR